MDVHIRVDGLNVYYGKTQVLKNISLEIPGRGITVVLGPSGCGKTTFLKSLNRFIDLEAGASVLGRVWLDDQEIYASGVDATQVRKKAGLLAQHPFPLPMSIFDNVAYGLRLHRLVRGGELRQRVRHYLEIAGLWAEVKDRLGAPATQLSLGQQQRLCLARGLAVEPEILLGDEPTSALDPVSAQHIEERLLDLRQNYTIVLVTHILRQARRLADYVIFMYMGEVIEHGLAQDVFHNPRQALTQAYFAGQF